MKWERVEWEDMTTGQKWAYGAVVPLGLLLTCGLIAWATGLFEPVSPDRVASMTAEAVNREATEIAATPVRLRTEEAAEAVMDARRATNAAEQATNPRPTRVIGPTFGQYKQLKNGMAYLEVRRIVGSAGEKTRSSTIEGSLYETFEWTVPGFGGGRLTANFRDGLLIGAFQYGLE